MNIKQWFWENKEGLVLGAVLGSVMFFMWIKTNNANILIELAKNTSGVFDRFRMFPPFVNMSLPQFLLTKVWLGFVTVGMIIGAVVDMLLPERVL